MIPNKASFSIHEYLKGKVADYTISDNVIDSVCYDRGVEPTQNAPFEDEVGQRTLCLCYADLLRYIYLQPTTTKSYSIANGTWSQKEGATTMSESDRQRILRELRRLYAKYGEPELIPQESNHRITMVAHGMCMRKMRRR